jgi:hypothetical protein
MSKKTHQGLLTSKKKRARTKKGTYKADNPATSDVNEAYVSTEKSILESYIETHKKFFTLY